MSHKIIIFSQVCNSVKVIKRHSRLAIFSSSAVINCGSFFHLDSRTAKATVDALNVYFRPQLHDQCVCMTISDQHLILSLLLFAIFLINKNVDYLTLTKTSSKCMFQKVAILLT